MKAFVLIEVLLAAAVASLLSVALLTSLNQVNRVKSAIHNTASLYAKIALLHDQIGRDMMGAFLPPPPPPLKRKQEKISPAAVEPGTIVAEITPVIQRKPLEKLFYAANQGQLLEVCTFITNNPMKVYWSETSGRPTPLITRIVYRLKPDPAVKSSYILTRQESDQLDFQEFDPKKEKGITAFELVEGIKSLTATFIAALEPSKEEKEAEKKEQAEGIKKERVQQFKSMQEWDDKKIKEIDKRLPIIPDYVRFDLQLWDSEHKRAESFSFTVPLFMGGIQGSLLYATTSSAQTSTIEQPAVPAPTPATASGGKK